MRADAASGAAAFRALHHGRTPGDPLILPGPWDAASARVFADAGFAALATPSAGVSASLGYPDGGATPPDEMFAVIARIARAVDIPVSADIEDGYGLAPKEIVERLLAAGAVGCNLEDSDAASKHLKDPRRHADWLAEVRAAAGDSLVINARVDTFLSGEPTAGAAIERGRLYAAAGADCVYPIAAPPELLPELAAAIGAPINALAGAEAGPDAPTPSRLGELGASRVTFGGGLHGASMAALTTAAERLRRS
ncbi:isocitrate lyase/phosphoenolpyruvate mutase family protein [Streptomyces sp. XD-27]|uniref:isocitrate lyase/PEP mutase family protein n=1 Tax=Streptomyces sp. XD-27 TaxID=3062779 RepID=UPI0026F43ABA|nr:isocitrate lyase/phosphoenolpyruvate mutase family protein [Streptomyces sp. XD-27]WKX74271.1 isocitrate lyase/phosphoenolpyruvate mutase family protein [Streptomyces sp. XD-27]